MTNFQIDIVSDSVCPWCYVGNQRLKKAIEIYKSRHPDSKDTFSTTWYPFYLNPAAPKQSIDKAAYYRSKFGDERSSMIIRHMTNVGKEAGINFSFGGKTGNTRDSHRLIQLAKTKGPDMQTKVVEELFSRYFEKEQDITSKEMLVEAGVKSGLPEKEVREWLESDKGGKEVDREVMEAQMKEISGVPHFTFQKKYEMGGAQDPEEFVQVFERVKRMEGANA